MSRSSPITTSGTSFLLYFVTLTSKVYATVDLTFLSVRIHLLPSGTPADISFIIAKVIHQGVDLNCHVSLVRTYLNLIEIHVHCEGRSCESVRAASRSSCAAVSREVSAPTTSEA
ncbi:hypothetical protein BJV78DRAFT_629278 [Lactifluus subvellereus]|nr:hypothetical protein BJV78DRAFT_629278 [Lactifluus subvellereus]